MSITIQFSAYMLFNYQVRNSFGKSFFRRMLWQDTIIFTNGFGAGFAAVVTEFNGISLTSFSYVDLMLESLNTFISFAVFYNLSWGFSKCRRNCCSMRPHQLRPLFFKSPSSVREFLKPFNDSSHYNYCFVCKSSRLIILPFLKHARTWFALDDVRFEWMSNQFSAFSGDALEYEFEAVDFVRTRPNWPLEYK